MRGFAALVCSGLMMNSARDRRRSDANRNGQGPAPQPGRLDRLIQDLQLARWILDHSK